MPLYKLTKGSIGLIVNGESVDIKKGDTVELSNERARDFKYLKKVGESAASKPITPEAEVVSTHDWSTSQDTKAPEVISQVNESNSVKDLEALYDMEEKGQNRATVLKAIEKRVATLEG